MRSARTTALTALVAAGALVLTACGGSDDTNDATDGTTDGSATDAGGPITVLIGSSGDAETQAVNEAVAAWAAESGVEATVTVATDLNQELSQGFAAGSPADVFYLSPDQLAGFASNGSVYPYGDQLGNVDDFYPSLVDNFTVDGQLYCAPKDFSTLALVINDAAWAAAGLSDADIPTDWDGLRAAAQALTTDSQVGLSFGPEYQRVGTFMAQAGGGLLDGDTVVADSPENLTAMEYVQAMLVDGIAAFPSQIDTGWGGEAFGSGKAAMTIEGNWIVGAMRNDFPDVAYTVVPLPAGAAGQGTLQFTNCWGIAADSQNQASAVSLVEFLTSTDQQLAFTEAFGVMPSVQSAADGFRSQFPEQAAFLDSVDFASGMPTQAGTSDAIGDFNGQLQGLATGDPQAMLTSLQTNLEAALGSAG